ncbi:diguanylate cyclase [Rhodococcus sp. MEB064]|uniref:diguanylate cyclase n=1 Tax=Rhodococcus sp. MEB064 TaxID=1587522 RepID=UPI0006990EF4|nr:diguanylate cyclase [Rhodococcus sp. MEB064]
MSTSRRFQDRRSLAMATTVTMSALLLAAGWGIPGLFHPGLVPVVATALAIVLAVVVVGIVVRTGRLTERQFVTTGAMAVVGTAVAAVGIADPADTLTVSALLTIVPVLAASASPPRTATAFTTVAAGLGTALCLDSASSPEADAVAAGASLTIVVVPVLLVWGLRMSMADVSRRYDVLARTDVLTGLLNRRGVLPLLDGMLRTAVGLDATITASVIDIDNFKAVNDTHGHTYGDRTLESVARTIVSAVPRGAVVARLGGEEFLVVAHHAPGADVALSVLRSVRAECAVTVSIGTSRAHPSTLDRTDDVIDVDAALDAMIARADEAMYAAKHGGRDRIAIGHDTVFHRRAHSDTLDASAAVAATLVELHRRGAPADSSAPALAALSERLDEVIAAASSNDAVRYVTALSTVASLDQCTGIVMEQLGVDRDDAVRVLVQRSRADGVSLARLCDTVMSSSLTPS